MCTRISESLFALTEKRNSVYDCDDVPLGDASVLLDAAAVSYLRHVDWNVVRSSAT